MAPCSFYKGLLTDRCLLTRILTLSTGCHQPYLKTLFMKQVKDITLFLYILGGALLLGGTVFQMLVIVPEFSRDIPNGMIGLAHSQVKPKLFWTSPLLPAGFLLGIIALVLNWKTQRRYWLLVSCIAGIAAEVFTIIYFYPRLKIMGIIDGNPLY